MWYVSQRQNMCPCSDVLGGYKCMRGKWLYSVDGGNTILEGIIAWKIVVVDYRL